MTLRSHLLGQDVPSKEIVIHGAGEEDEWVQELRYQRPELKISLSNEEYTLESLQQDEEANYGAYAGAEVQSHVHILPADTASKAVVQATDDALKNPEDTIVVLPEDDDADAKRKLKETFEKTDAVIVEHVSAAVEAIMQRFPE